MRPITKKTVFRSCLVSLFMTVVGLSLQFLESAVVQGSGPPSPGCLAGLIACYLAAGFTYALGFFILSDRLPGRGAAGRGLRYAGLVLAAVWLSGFINLAAVDYEGGWNPLSPLKVDAFWMFDVDCANFLLGGLVLGFIARKDAPAERRETAASRTPRMAANLALKMAAGAVILPILCAGVYHLVELFLPLGADLSGEKGRVFDAFLFVPLAISGAGTGLFHETLRNDPRRGVLHESSRQGSFLYLMYWVPNVAFVLFLGFTWQMTVIFYIALAPALLASLMAMEALARAMPEEARST